MNRKFRKNLQKQIGNRRKTESMSERSERIRQNIEFAKTRIDNQIKFDEQQQFNLDNPQLLEE